MIPLTAYAAAVVLYFAIGIAAWRVAEIESQIDVKACRDPSVDVPSEDMELWQERDRLLWQKGRLEKVVDEGLP